MLTSPPEAGVGTHARSFQTKSLGPRFDTITRGANAPEAVRSAPMAMSATPFAIELAYLDDRSYATLQRPASHLTGGARKSMFLRSRRAEAQHGSRTNHVFLE